MKRGFSSGTATFFIDGHRGSPPALAKVLTDAPVRLCVRHLIANKSMRPMGAVNNRLPCFVFDAGEILIAQEGLPLDNLCFSSAEEPTTTS